MTFKMFCLLFSSLALLSCSTGGSKQPQAANGLSWTVDELVAETRNAVRLALKTQKTNELKEHAERGRNYADQCIERAPEEAACYYYRAVHIGLHSQAQVLGYQTGVKEMIRDATRSYELDETYDHGGAHRLLGELYTKLPPSVSRPDSIARDLEKGAFHLRRAIRLSPQYPENHLKLAETLIAKGELDEALRELARSKELAVEWTHDDSYETWLQTSRELENKIAQK